MHSDRWCPAHSVEVLAELDPNTLFGSHGAAPLPVFEVAERRDEATVTALAAARDGGSPARRRLLVVNHLVNLSAKSAPGQPLWPHRPGRSRQRRAH